MALNQDGDTVINITSEGNESIMLATEGTYADRNIIFNVYKNRVNQGIDTSDATATANDIAAGKTAYVNSEKITGSLGETKTSQSYSVSASDATLNLASGMINITSPMQSDRILRQNATVIQTVAANKLGDASARDVVESKTFSSFGGIKQTGAIPKISGDSFYTFNNSLNYMADNTADKFSVIGYLDENQIICFERTKDFPNLNVAVSKDKLGDATPADVAAGKTFTSSAGLKITGTKEDIVSGTKISIEQIDQTVASRATSITFNNLKGEPIWFSMDLNDSLTDSSYNRCVTVQFYDGVLEGNYTSGTSVKSSSSYYTKTYNSSNKSLTISSQSAQNGGYMHNGSNGYALSYAYIDDTNGTPTQIGIAYHSDEESTAQEICFDLAQKPNWFTIYKYNVDATSGIINALCLDFKNDPEYISAHYLRNGIINTDIPLNDPDTAYEDNQLYIDCNVSGITYNTNCYYKIVYGYTPTGNDNITLQSNKTVTPSTSQQIVTPDSGYSALSQVTVNSIPSNYIVPTGNKSITSNGTNIDVAQYSTVSVNVSTGTAQSWPSSTSSTATNSTGQTAITAGTGALYLNLPAGTYSSAKTYKINALSSLTLPTTTSTTASGTRKATISASTTGTTYLNIPVGYNSTAQYYQISQASGVTAPARFTKSISSGSTVVFSVPNASKIGGVIAWCPTQSSSAAYNGHPVEWFYNTVGASISWTYAWRDLGDGHQAQGASGNCITINTTSNTVTLTCPSGYTLLTGQYTAIVWYKS